MNDKQRVLIGRIGAPHGVRGEVTIQSYAEDPRAIASYGPLETEDGKRRVELKIVRVTAKGIVARIAGIDDRNGVEALKGLALYVERSRLPAAAEGEFYRADLIGLRVVDSEGRTLGNVVGGRQLRRRRHSGAAPRGHERDRAHPLCRRVRARRRSRRRHDHHRPTGRRGGERGGVS